MSKLVGLLIILASVFGGYVWAGGALSALGSLLKFQSLWARV